ncbi:hypothetical protein H0H87_001390 [Tephrocybe sp. NHM501043]|nr:hypothetical protein H0H87_001390 [Tephrocybe sp. NHM501043]
MSPFPYRIRAPNPDVNHSLVLYIIYYPPHLKYITSDVDTHDSRPPVPIKTPIRSPEWRLSIILAWVVAIHMGFITFTTFLLLLTTPTSSSPAAPLPHVLERWATFLGVSSAMLAAIQYAPQLVHTYKAKLVGALSIPMMCIQSPGAVLMVISIALRPGTDWTSTYKPSYLRCKLHSPIPPVGWITFAVSGIMQGSLLVMCIVFHLRQRQLGIDEFGHPLPGTQEPSRVDEEVPGLVTEAEEDPRKVKVALVRALESATGSDIRASREVSEVALTEATPLLGKPHSEGARKGWKGWFRRG